MIDAWDPLELTVIIVITVGGGGDSEKLIGKTCCLLVGKKNKRKCILQYCIWAAGPLFHTPFHVHVHMYNAATIVAT
jgi:hypothetical protein